MRQYAVPKLVLFDHVRQSLENSEEGGFVETSPTWSFVYNILDTRWSILSIVGLRSSHRQAREEHSIPRHQMLGLGKRKIEMECPRHKLEHQTRSVGNQSVTRKYNGWLYVVKQ